MAGLLRDLLSLAKTDEGGANIVMSEFSLSGALLNTVLEFESRAFEEKREYAYEIGENIRYTGDEKQIRQLAGILIDNAIRYSDANGKVKVTLRAENGRARFSVYNTGGGVPDAQKNKIFERFYRADESRSRDTGGYGVGLSIAKAIADAHKGRIAVSGEYGKWVRFDVML
jgi:signal transduction histidine kinase